MTAGALGPVFRCFVAVPLPAGAKQFLAAFMSRAKPAFPGYRFGAAQNLHITLQFLGDVERAKIPFLMKTLNDAAASVPPFRLGLGGSGSFPEHGAPRILHISIGPGKQELSVLAAKVNGALSAAGYRPDKPFVAHITLGRARDRQARPGEDTAAEWRAAYSAYVSESGSPEQWDAAEMLLMESVLAPGGPSYTARGTVHLSGKS
ncbi:MAG: RNA 2',3'-cyclic phosphodiesterase [Bacillota bacterium]